MVRRLLLWVSVLLLASAAGAQPPTPTRTQTWTPEPQFTETPAATMTITDTPEPSVTGTPLPEHRIKPELIDWGTPVTTPPSVPSCVYVLRSDNGLPECIPLSNGSIGGTQRKCVTTGVVAAATVANVCVTWDAAYGAAGDYTVIGSVIDAPTGSIAGLTLHHLAPWDAVSACALLFNQSADTAHTGTLCLEAFPL